MTGSLKSLLLVSYLDRIAREADNGIFPFSQCSDGNRRKWKKGILYVDEEGGRFRPGSLVLDKCIDEEHHDIITAWDDIFGDIGIEVETVIDEEYEGVRLFLSDGESRIRVDIEDGEWKASLLTDSCHVGAEKS